MVFRRSKTAVAYSAKLDKYLWQSSDEEDVVNNDGKASTATSAAPVPALVVALPSASAKAGNIAPQSNPSQSSRTSPRLAQQPLLADCPLGSTARPSPPSARRTDQDPPTIRPDAQVCPKASSLVPQPSVVHRPSDSTDRPSPAMDAATKPCRSDPYTLVRGIERNAPDQEALFSSGDYIEDWRPYRVNLHKELRWWEWDHGIIDLRALYRCKGNATAGTQLRKAFDACQCVLQRHACEFKVGMARSLGGRWELYQTSSVTWTPTHLFIVMLVRGRDAVGFAEAGLIGMLEACGDFNIERNVNKRNRDKGGSGPRHEQELDDLFYVYLATRSLC